VSVFIDDATRLLVQGITGRDGSFHAKQMIEYGTRVVAGVTPGKGSQRFEGTVPIFNTVAEAVQATGANTTVIYVPPPFAADAMMEAAAAGVKLIVCITEGVPVLDMTRVYPFVKESGARLVGPNCPGLITPGQSKVGIIPGRICAPGNVGVVSRSGTLTYEVVYQLTRAGMGQSTCVGIGGDPINGTNFIDVLRAYESDPETRAVAMMAGPTSRRPPRS
jgi:succinyl-CoA synthetase alpha subunit